MCLFLPLNKNFVWSQWLLVLLCSALDLGWVVSVKLFKRGRNENKQLVRHIPKTYFQKCSGAISQNPAVHTKQWECDFGGCGDVLVLRERCLPGKAAPWAWDDMLEP